MNENVYFAIRLSGKPLFTIKSEIRAESCESVFWMRQKYPQSKASLELGQFYL